MYPSVGPFIFALHFIVVAAAVLGTLFTTHNPLALLGLYFLPSVPLVPEDGTGISARGEELDDDEPGIGFTAKLK